MNPALLDLKESLTESLQYEISPLEIRALHEIHGGYLPPLSWIESLMKDSSGTADEIATVLVRFVSSGAFRKKILETWG